jgi:hypothetical protein
MEKGRDNRERVRRYFITHPGCTNIDCAAALGLNVCVVGRHSQALRAEWINNPIPIRDVIAL